ncbi:MAG TPA: hypothetical protein VNA15_03700 [Candidatus Angelobacter sp.]|nr:hypothetical protein [Candidatus Angelobacter sp.]
MRILLLWSPVSLSLTVTIKHGSCNGTYSKAVCGHDHAGDGSLRQW